MNSYDDYLAEVREFCTRPLLDTHYLAGTGGAEARAAGDYALDERLWKLACLDQTVEGYRAYVQNPGIPGVHSDEALARIAQFTGKQYTNVNLAAHAVEEMPSAAQPSPGDSFRDLPEGPDMVVLPAGEFWMGSPESEQDRWSAEGPRHLVRIHTLAVSKTPITFAQWDACVAAGGSSHTPGDASWGRGDRPVINVSWRDAQDYVRWLSRATGHTYRLLSESEWEYAARAGQGERRFPWGDDLDHRDLPMHAWFKGNGKNQTQPVGLKLANAFGLFDMHGNVWEWVEDTYQSHYNDTPTDGAAQVTSHNLSRVMRGGSWMDSPRQLRSASRERFPQDHRAYTVGFRVARVIDIP